MKKNKILSLILMLTLFLSMSMVAFAVEGDPVPPTDPAGNPFGDQTGGDWKSVNFKKSITTIGNDGALHPAETFAFTITPVSAVDEQNVAIDSIPAINNFDIVVTEGNGEATATVNLPTYAQVGTYVYNVVETASDTAGMVYDENEYTFTVIVLNEYDEDGTFKQLKRLILKDEDGIKTDVFDNKYNAGSLIVNKEITGNNANFTETFPVKVTLTPAEGKTINSTILAYSENVTNIDVGTKDATTGVIEVTFNVTNDSKVTIKNIPYGTSYVVEEVEVVDGKIKGYTPNYDNNKTGIIEAASIETNIINDLSRDIATGINLDNLPYMILVAATAAGIATIVIKRRRSFEF